MNKLKLQLITILCLIVCIPIFGQSKEWLSLKENNYSIEYPPNWELNNTGEMGSSFILFSELASKNDGFKENVNLVIQDLTEYNIDLNQYVDISENQIKTMITESELISSERIMKNAGEYHKLIFTGKQGVYNLKFEQHYWVQNNKAYVLTLTCEQSEFENYKAIGERILDSFKINE